MVLYEIKRLILIGLNMLKMLEMLERDNHRGAV